MKRLLLSLIALAFFSVSAQAASCFWVGGTGNWTDGGTHWASTTGGSAGTCAGSGGGAGTHYPSTGDTATLDGSSGGGTVTQDIVGDVTLSNLTLSAFTGTLDFSANNNNVTIAGAVTDAASGAHTWNLGSGTWTINGTAASWAITASGTNLTFNGASSTIAINATSNVASDNISFGTAFNGSSSGYGTVTMQGTVSSSIGTAYNIINAGVTIPTLTLIGPVKVTISSGITLTIGNAFNWAGTASAPIMLLGSSSTSRISIANASTASWISIQSIGFDGNGDFTATNSFDYGFVRASSGTGVVTITAPSLSGGGGVIIGG